MGRDTKHILNLASKLFEVIDLSTNYSHGKFETLDEAKGAVQFDRLTHYAIWQGNTRVVICEPDNN